LATTVKTITYCALNPFAASEGNQLKQQLLRPTRRSFSVLGKYAAYPVLLDRRDFHKTIRKTPESTSGLKSGDGRYPAAFAKLEFFLAA
jgi:hypothetical protein